MISAGDNAMVRIPAGDYNGKKVEAFWVDQTETTNGFAAYVALKDRDRNELRSFTRVEKREGAADAVIRGYYYKDRLSHISSGSGWGSVGKILLPKRVEGFDGNNQPLVDVREGVARTICEAQGKRLLTPTEWKYAAGGPEHFEFSTRDGSFDEAGIHSSTQTRQETTRDVGADKGHCVLWGGVELCGMSGNVWEWTYDPESREYYACGGAWNIFQSMRYLRTDYCSVGGTPSFFVQQEGLRCASDEPPQSVR